MYDLANAIVINMFQNDTRPFFSKKIMFIRKGSVAVGVEFP